METTVQLELSGELTVSRADETAAALGAALAEHTVVEICFRNVSALDLSCLQMMCALHRTAAAQNKQVWIKEEGADVFRETARRAGFVRDRACSFSVDGKCLYRTEAT